MLSFLNNIPLASVIAVAAVIGGIIALANGSIDFQEFLVGIGATTAGAGVLGHARNGAGHGVH
jgi:hypothetical protein